VNRNEYNVEGHQMTVPYKQGIRYFDLYHGVELKPEIKGDQSGAFVSHRSHGYAAIFATSGELDPKLGSSWGR
jgi:iron(II)-dependent oxidoreductase